MSHLRRPDVKGVAFLQAVPLPLLQQPWSWKDAVGSRSRRKQPHSAWVSPAAAAGPTARALHTAPAAPTGAPTPEQHQDRDTALPGSPTTSTKTPRTCKCFITIPGRQSTLQTAQREPSPWADEQRNAAIVGGKGQQSNCSHCRAGPSHTARTPAGCPWCSAWRGRGWWQRRIPSVLELSCVPQQPGASTAALGTFREGDLPGMVPNRTRCHKSTMSSFHNLFSGLFAGYLH